jgi:hypothetical protein
MLGDTFSGAGVEYEDTSQVWYSSPYLGLELKSTSIEYGRR